MKPKISKLQQFCAIALLSVMFLALAFACSRHDTSLPDQLVKPNVEATYSESGTTRNYCDQPGQNAAGIHSSFTGIRKFVEQLEKQPRHLAPAECVAVAAFAKSNDWFGDSCADRTAKTAEKWIRRCFENDWKRNAEYSDGDCLLLGHNEDNYYESPEVLRTHLSNNFADCMWSEDRRHEVLTRAVIEAAIESLTRQQ